MQLLPLAVSALTLAAASVDAVAVSQPKKRLEIPIQKYDKHFLINKRNFRTPEQTFEHAKRQRAYILNKWGNAFGNGSETKETNFGKRQGGGGLVGLTDVGPDTYYFAQVGFGTPLQQMAIVLDTGSADLWIATTECNTADCVALGRFNESASSTFQSSTQPFQVTYGQGGVTGTMAADTVSLAGFTVSHQSFGVAQQLAADTISAPASGLMGMGFQQLSAAGVTPFWQVLAKQNKLQTQAFSFQLARAGNVNETTQSPGGVFTLGEIDSNQYSGSINYINIPSNIQQYGYWAIPLQSISLNGNKPVTLGQVAAIDTGTTLIAVPMRIASSIYSSINGAQPVSELGQGYYAFPCANNVQISFSFGGISYDVNPLDFSAGVIDQSGTYCLGSIFGIDTGGAAPPYIVGDAFLKSVFSVYNAEPPSVGFAKLKGSSAQTVSTTGGIVTATAGAASAQSTSSAANGGGIPGQYTRQPNAQQATGSSIYYASGVSSPVAAGTTYPSNPQLSSGNNGGSGSGRSSAAASTNFFAGSSVVLAGLAGIFFILM